MLSYMSLTNDISGVIHKEWQKIALKIIHYGVYFLIIILNFIRIRKNGGSFFKFSKKDNWKGQMAKHLKNNNKYVESGLVLGKIENKIIYKSESEAGHTLVIGGLDTGKTTGISIPTLKKWKKRIFCIDIGENFLKKSNRTGNIKQFGMGFLGYDPFYLLKESPLKAQVAKEISITLIPNFKENNYKESAQLIAQAAFMHFYKDHSFSETINLILDSKINDLIMQLSESEDNKIKKLVSQIKKLTQETLSLISMELSNSLMPFATDEELEYLFSNKIETITPKDILSNDIFIRVDEHKLDNWKNLLNLIISQQISYFNLLNVEDILDETLFLFDEFTKLGQLESVVNSLSTLKNKKVRFAIITQSISQLDVVYGQDMRNIIINNCSHKIIFKLTDYETQDYFSRLTGTYEAVKRTIGRSEKDNIFSTYNTPFISESITTEEKRIFKPEDFHNLNNEIILFSPDGCYKINKINYYKENDLFEK